MRWILITLLLCGSTRAADYYVANSGNDSADGLSAKNAWRSLARIEKQPLEPGDCVHLAMDNIWRESLRLTRSGTAEKPIIIKSELPDASHSMMAIISGADDQNKPARDYCIDIAASHVVIEGIVFENAANPQRGAIMIWADQDRSDIAIRWCVIRNTLGRGVWTAGDQGKNISDLKIERSVFKDIAGSPIQIVKMKGGRITHNKFIGNCRAIVDTWQAAIRLWSSDVSDVEVSANQISDQKFNLGKSEGMGIHIDEVGPNVVVKDNDITGSDSTGILVENTQGVQVVNNKIDDVHTGIFFYRAGHDHLISRNTVHAHSLGIVLQGHRAHGVDAGPEIEKMGLLFTGNRIEKNISVVEKDASLKVMGGAENAGPGKYENVISGNCFGPERGYLFQWGDRYLSKISELNAAASQTNSIAYPADKDLSKIDAGAKR